MSRSIKANVTGHRDGEYIIPFPSNRVQNAYPSLLVFIPISVTRQYLRPLSFYFLVICALAFVKEISPFHPMSQFIPVVLVLSVSVFRETIQEKRRQEEDLRVNTQTARVNRSGKWVETKWEDMAVGDVVMIASDSPSPADMVMVASSSPGNSAYIQTTNLDGESNFKPRFGIDKAVATLDLMTAPIQTEQRRPELIIHAEAPRSDLDWFQAEAVFHLMSNKEIDMAEVDPSDPLSPSSRKGEMLKMNAVEVCQLTVKNFIPREATIKGAEWIIGVIVYTGPDTKVLLGQQKPQYKMSKIDKITNQLVLLIMFLQVSISSLIAGGAIIADLQPRWWLNLTRDSRYEYPTALLGFFSFFACMLLITMMIPISMVISLEIAKVYQAVFMRRDEAMPGAATPSQALNDDLGQIGYILSDKTGTLTSNELVLKVATVNGVAYPDLVSLGKENDAKKNPIVLLFVDALSLCHDIAPNWSSNQETTSKVTSMSSIGGMKSVANKERAIRSGASTPAGGDLPSLEGLSYCGESPDEMCLVSACSNFLGKTMTKRSQSGIVIFDHGMRISRRWGIVRMNSFDNARRRSSIIVSKPPPESISSQEQQGDDSYYVFVKGSDDAVMPCCRFESVDEKKNRDVCQNMINKYAKESLRTLVFGFKRISKSQLLKLDSTFTSPDKLLSELESGLTLLGCTGTEDRLQEGVPGSIERLRIAGIAVWMITGDKLDTAVEISKSANLISPQMNVVTIDIETEAKGGDDRELALNRLKAANDNVAAVITGRSIRHLVTHDNDDEFIQILLQCKSVVVCRSTKDQKAQMVSLIQKVIKGQVLVLAIGDGANDVPMIKKADVGVGIAGKEGRQAAQNADYVVTQFKHLERLVLFHGRLNYVRTSKMVLYFLFKNLVLSFPFAIHTVISTLFSSSMLVTSTVGMSFNTVLTSIPVFVLGLLERDVSPNDRLISFASVSAHALAQAYPKLYMTGRQNRMFTRRLLGSVFVSALLIGTWIYMICLLPLGGLYTTNSQGKMLHHWDVSVAYFIGVFTVDTAAAVLISEGLTMPMVFAVAFSAFACVTFLISDAFDASSPAGKSLWILITEAPIGLPILLLAFLPPIMVGVGVKSWKYRFDPTARMVWQEAKHRADRRRAALSSSPSSRKAEIAAQDIIYGEKSVFYRPEEFEEAPLIPH